MIKDRTVDRLSWLILGLSFLLWGLVLVKKFIGFGYFDWDLAILTQALWMLGRGSQYFSLGDYNFFGDHANYIALFFIPFVKFFPHALTLLFVKVLAFHAAALSFYVIARRLIEPAAAALMLLTFLIFPANVLAMLYEFNFDIIGMVALMWMIYAFMAERYGLFLLASVFGLLVKENMYLVFIMFGVMASVGGEKDRIKWGLVPIATGALLFYLIMFHVLPHFRGLHSSAFAVRYGHLGGSTGEILLFILANPLKVLAILADPYNLDFLRQLFGANLFLSPLSPHILLLSAPLFLQHLLSNNAAEHSITSHYSHLLVPFIFLSAVSSLRWLQPRLTRYFRHAILSIALIVFVLTGFQLFQHHGTILRQFAGQDRETVRQKWELVRELPGDAAVIATLNYTAPLSPREHLYSLHMIYEDRFQSESGLKDSFLRPEPFRLPAHVTYALIDFDYFPLVYRISTEADKIIPRIEEFFDTYTWMVEAAYQRNVLLRRLSREEEARLRPEDFTYIPLQYPQEAGADRLMRLRVVK